MIENPHDDPQTSTREARNSTRWRLVEAARQLLADPERSAISVRDITSAAGVNLGAVNYHFGSRAGLFEEIFRQLIDQLMARRDERLDKAQRVSSLSGQPVSLAQLVDCFLDPAYEFACEDPEGFELLERIGHQVLVDNNLSLSEPLLRRMGNHLERFARVAAGASRGSSVHRAKATLLLSSQMLAFRSLEASLRSSMLPDLPGLPTEPPDWDSFLIRLKAFVIRSLHGEGAESGS